jgi:molybdenum cofactor synthesis domain-containing protein
MDGIAVTAEKTLTATLANPLALKENRDFQWLDTGDCLPNGFDAVIMVEDVHRLEKGEVEITSPAVPGQNIRPIGEDFKEGQLLLPSGRLLAPHDLAAAASCGLNTLQVRRRPRVAVIPTGDELVPPCTPDLKPGQIAESNSTLLRGMLRLRGAEVKVWPICKDDPALLKEALTQALEESDLVLINAGSSAGRDDYTAQVVADLGRTLVHGIAIRPGAPVIMGVVQGKPVLGVPGYPVSTALVCEIIALPLLDIIAGVEGPDQSIIQAKLLRRLVSPAGREEHLRVNVASINNQWVAIPGSRGSGNLRSLAEADGWVVVPEGSQGLEAGIDVEVRLQRTKASLKRTLVVAGSGACLDQLACDLAPHTRLVSIPADERGALLALKRGEAHLALAGNDVQELAARYLEAMDIEFVKAGDSTFVLSRNNLQLPGVDKLQRKADVGDAR